MSDKKKYPVNNDKTPSPQPSPGGRGSEAAIEPPTVLWIGAADGPEFQAIFRWLTEHSQLAAVPDPEAATEYLAAGAAEPELIVLVESLPGEFTEADIVRFRRRAPLARTCELLGTWCEGVPRVDQPLGGASRLAWHQWVARMTPEFARRAAGFAPGWSLPVTATDDERLLSLATLPKARDRGLLAIHTRQGELARTICDACPSRGWAGIWLHRRRPYLSGIRAMIWDVPRAPDDWAAELAELRATAAPIVALVNFPRVEDHERLTAAGVSAIVSKPLWLDDLFGQLERL